jgi:hypothetical protein
LTNSCHCRHRSHLLSQRKRKLIEQAFGWLKTVAGLRKFEGGGAMCDAYEVLTVRCER